MNRWTFKILGNRSYFGIVNEEKTTLVNEPRHAKRALRVILNKMFIFLFSVLPSF